MPSIKQYSLPYSPDFSPANFLSAPTEVRLWNTKGLPTDNFSTENGVLVTKARRWPLAVDPQGQGNQWIKQLEKEHSLKVCDLKMSDWMRTMENAIQFGQPMLMQVPREYVSEYPASEDP